MSHETPLSMMVFQKPDGSTGELDVHDAEAVHTVDTNAIVDEAVTTAKLADQAVTSEKIADGAVGRDQLDPDFVESCDSLCQEEVNQYVTASRWGRLVFVRVDYGKAVSSSTTIATLPEEFRPTAEIVETASGGTSSLTVAPARIYVQPSGSVRVYASPQVDSCRGSVCYLV